MARIRSAKPEFWTDPLMTSLSRDVRFTFKGIFEVCADDFGFFLGDARLVKSQVWPLDDDLTVKKVDAMLRKLDELGRIHLYEVDGVRYGQVVNWSKHQRVDHPSPSRIPRENVANGSRAIPEQFASVSRPRARRGERIGEERIGKEAEAVVKEGARDEPGSAAALVAPLPNCEEPTHGVAAIQDAAIDANGQRLGPPETPAQSPNGTAPPADGRSAPRVSSAINGVDTPALDLVLPVAAVKLLRTFYPRGKTTDERRLDVFEQMQQLLKPEGLAFKGGVIRVTPARLSGACLAVLKSHAKGPLEDPDAALPYLLTKLSDVSQDSPTEKAAVEAKVEELRDRETFAERQARADKIAGEYPDEDQRLREAAKRIFPGKDKEMAQPRESYRVSQLLALHIEVPS